VPAIARAIGTGRARVRDLQVPSGGGEQVTTRLERTVERRQIHNPAMRRASWSAIFGGAFIALAVLLLTGTLGIAIGATVIDPAGDSPGATAFGIGAGLWWLASGILALFCGGWAAGRLAGLRRRLEGPLHGAITWALVTVGTVFLAMTVLGAMVSGAMRVVGFGVSTAGQSAGDVIQGAGDVPAVTDRLEQEAPQDLEGVKESATEAAKQVQEAAPEVAQHTADALAVTAWWSFLYLLITAIAAVLGGFVGAPRSNAPVAEERVEVAEGRA
jgi:hypothetical protein